MTQKTLVIHAPNVHTGGGFVLLKEVLNVKNPSARWVQLDERVKQSIKPPKTAETRYIKRSILARFFAEWRLWRYTSNDDIVLCFHNLPPLLPVKAQVVVFMQNRLLLEEGRLTGYPLVTRMRIFIERAWLKIMHRSHIRYLVQTPSMMSAISKRLGRDAKVTVMPFVPSSILSKTKKISSLKKYDFVYVASGDAHKNHANLLEAWVLLAKSGIKPSLALTIDQTLYPSLFGKIKLYTREFSLNIINLGQLQMKEISDLYSSSSALIFPSMTESFGLPLVEAHGCGLPILAGELDYVRDLVQPVQTFDANSPLSIARAVKRFLNKDQGVIHLHSAQDFLEEVMK